MQGTQDSIYIRNLALIMLSPLALGGCLSQEKDDDAGPKGSNSPPTISGNPCAAAKVDDTYSFTPDASDADGDGLTFSIESKPAWAGFSTASGKLSGRPTLGDVGVYADISISVSDGQESASLSPFSITVEQTGALSTTLSWTAPTENDDGTALTDLAGYNLYWGTESGVYTESVNIDNAGVTSYVVDNLVACTYEFVATAYNTSGVESMYSNTETKVLE